MIFMLLLALPLVSSSSLKTSSSDLLSKKGSIEDLVGISENMGKLIFEEDFRTVPFGLNSSLWNLITINNPSLAWSDGDRIDLWGERFKTIVLRSKQVFSQGIIAKVNTSFTQGSCYSCFGWCDDWHDQDNDWIANGRLCRNGVFIDCWDGELFLVAYANGERTVTHIDVDELTGWHNIVVEWTESLVRMEIDMIPVAFISRMIPNSPLTMTFMVSGHHDRVEPGRLSLEHVAVYEYQRDSKSSDPEIILLRPENNSIVYAHDLLDFEVEGAATNLSCFWEKGPSFMVDTPWDIQVPSVIYGGPHTLPVTTHLTLEASTAGGHKSTATFTFRIDEPESEYGIWSVAENPVMDGIIDESEATSASHLDVNFRNECGEKIAVSLLAAYTPDSLYIAIVSPIPDSYHSRATLFLDANADKEWSNESSDVGITLASPTANPSYTGIFGPPNRLIPSLTYGVSETDSMVTYEFLIPLEFLNIDEKIGVAFGVQLSHGGYNLEFPDKYYLEVVYNLGFPALDKNGWQFAMLSASLLLSGAVIVVSIYKIRRETLYFEEATNEEPMQRLKILLLSYNRISLPRLARMMNLDPLATSNLVENLIAHGFPINFVSDEVVRLQKVAERIENNLL